MKRCSIFGVKFSNLTMIDDSQYTLLSSDNGLITFLVNGSKIAENTVRVEKLQHTPQGYLLPSLISIQTAFNKLKD